MKSGSRLRKKRKKRGFVSSLFFVVVVVVVLIAVRHNARVKEGVVCVGG